MRAGQPEPDTEATAFIRSPKSETRACSRLLMPMGTKPFRRQPRIPCAGCLPHSGSGRKTSCRSSKARPESRQCRGCGCGTAHSSPALRSSPCMEDERTAAGHHGPGTWLHRECALRPDGRPLADRCQLSAIVPLVSVGAGSRDREAAVGPSWTILGAGRHSGAQVAGLRRECRAWASWPGVFVEGGVEWGRWVLEPCSLATSYSTKSGRISRPRIRWMTTVRTASYVVVPTACCGAVSVSALPVQRSAGCSTATNTARCCSALVQTAL